MKIKAFLLMLVISVMSFTTPVAVTASEYTVRYPINLIWALEDGMTNIKVSFEAGGIIQDFTDPAYVMTIPAGTTITFLNVGPFVTINCIINNYGTIINYHQGLDTQNGGVINNYGTFNNYGRYYMSAGILNNKPGGTIRNTGKIQSNASATINNEGRIISSGDFLNNGTYTGNPVELDNEAELIYNGNSTYYSTFEAAVAAITNSGYEIHILKDIVIDGDVKLPYVPFTLSGAREGGGVHTLTVNNGNFTPTGDGLIKNIKLAHTGTGGDFNVYNNYQLHPDYPYYEQRPVAISLGSGVLFEDIDFMGIHDVNSQLNILGDVDLGSNSISNVKNISIKNGSTLKVRSVSAANLNLDNGNLDITESNGLNISGQLNGTGEKNTLFLPSLAEHSGIEYSIKLTSTSFGGITLVTILPSDGVTLSNKGKLIYLANPSIEVNKFVSGDPKFVLVKRTLDGKPYLTFINASHTDFTGTVTSLTYGAESHFLTTKVTDGQGKPLTTGTVKFYKGTSADTSKLIETVSVNSGGIAAGTVNIIDYITVGDNTFYALYEDITDFYHSSNKVVTIRMAPKSLSVSGVTIEDKTYDGTAHAGITGVSLSGLMGDDTVTAEATAVFTNLDAGENKHVNLTGITLSGADAHQYQIASERLDIATTAKIIKKAPGVQLSAPPQTEVGPSFTVNLKASIFGVASGSIPGGSVTFYNGEELLGSSPCDAKGEAAFVWPNVPEGAHDLFAQYSGDINYSTVTGGIPNYTIRKFKQAGLTVSGKPANIIYGDAFALNVSGGTGAGAVSFMVTSGTSVVVDTNSGEVTAVGVGESIITVAKAGTIVYEPISTDVVLNVAPKSLSINGATANNKSYDGTTHAEVTGGTLEGGVVTGDAVVLDTSTAVGQFADKKVGTDKVVSVSGYTLEGEDALYYTLIQPTLTADIEKKEITVSQIVISDKVYDGTVSAVIAGITLSWKAVGDEIYVNIPAASAVFSDENVENNKLVSVTGLELVGADSENYRLIDAVASTTGNIIPAGTVATPMTRPTEDFLLSGTGVTLSVTSADAIYYTLDGSMPTTGDSLYVSPIMITGTPGTSITIKAFAVKIGMADSGIMTKQYTIKEPDSFIITAVPGDQEIKLSWEAIPRTVSYLIYDSEGHYVGEGIVITDQVFGCTFTGLTNGIPYTFTVKALDAEARITHSAHGNATPLTMPGTPTHITATAGDGQATVSFAAPADDGGSPVTGYVVSTSPGGITASGTGISITVKGLINGITYTFTVKAVNLAGHGAESEQSNAIIPYRVSSGHSDGDDSDTNSKVYAFTLPVRILLSDDFQQTHEIKTDIAELILPSGMLMQGNITDTQNVILTIAQANLSDLDHSIRNQIGGRPVIQLSLMVNGKPYTWSNEATPVTVSIPYKPAAEELKNPEHITVWYIDGAGNAVPVPNGCYNPETGTVTFTTTHFSSFAVVYVKESFEDLDGVAWAKKPIEVLASKGILRGITEGKYAPEANITRADFLCFLVRTLGVEAKADGNFDDIKNDAYYYKELAIAKKLGITYGTGNNKFSPNASITRQDMMVLTERALRMLNKLKIQGTASDLDKFSDKSLIAPYALDSMATVVKEGLIVGDFHVINPGGNTTRASAAVFLYKIYNKYQ